MPTRRDILIALPAAVPAVLHAGAAFAQPAWAPSQPVDFLVMAGRGGGADLAVRFFETVVKDNGWCPMPFVVRNLPGRSGFEALTELARRRGDRHALLFTLNSFYTAPLTNPDPAIDVTSFAPIARMAQDNFLLWVGSERREMATLQDFVETVRQAGRGWTMGGTGTESEDQLLCDFLNASYDLKMSYKAFGGGGSVAKALAEGVVQSTVNNPSEARALMAQGRVKPLVSFSSSRLPEFKTTPTLRETGMSFTYAMQRSVVGPPGLPPVALDYYVALFAKVFASPAWQEYRARNSLFGPLLSGPALTTFWAGEREKHKRWLMAMRAMRG